jgi:RHS repeat-associated protein
MTDHQGSTRGLISSAGSIISGTLINYDSFGKPSISLPTRFQYTGREYDPDTKLYYYRARWYDPEARRFISEDPIGLNGGINLYGYVGNNPLNRIDPWGLQDILIIDKTAPVDSGIPGTSYGAQIYVKLDDNTIFGPYRGSSYPNTGQRVNGKVVPYSGNMLDEGVYTYNNLYGHDGGQQKGLNFVDDNGRFALGLKYQTGMLILMSNVNLHAGFSDLGGPLSRGSRGCPTIHPDDVDHFFSHFQWNKNSNVGTSQGKIIIYRGGGSHISLGVFSEILHGGW